MTNSDAPADTLEAVIEQVWALGLRDPKAGAKTCKQALKRFPDAPILWSLRGRLFLKARDHEKAAPALERALELAPDDAVARLALAETRLAQGLPMTALAVLDGAPHASGFLRCMGVQVGSLRLRAGDYHGAVEVLTTETSEPIAGPMLEYAREAGASESAQGLQPDDKRAYLAATEALVRGEPAKAQTVFAGLVERAPGYGPAWVGLRGAMVAQGRADPQFPDAPDAMRPSLARKPGRRGLVFDPRDTFPLRPRAELMREATNLAELARGQDAWLTIDRGGVAVELRPTIACGGAGDGVGLAYDTAEGFVGALGDAALVGRGVAIGRCGALVEELQPQASPDKFGARLEAGGVKFDPAPFRDGFCAVRTFDEPALLMAGPTDGAFGDWMVNFMPRIALANRAGLDVPLVIRTTAPPFVRRTLAFLGFGEERLFEHAPEGVSVFRRLYVPSWPLPMRGRATAGLLQGLEVDAPAHASGPQRLYLSRENMKPRPLVNEREVRACFEAKGFVTVYPEQLALEELHALLSSARHVAGPYGSAFLNLAFCRRKPTCLVCAPAYYDGFLREITLWLGSMGAPFGLLLGEAGDAGPLREAPWTLDLGRLEGAIERVLEVD